MKQHSRKRLSAKNIFVIVTPVCNSTLKITQMKVLFFTMILVMMIGIVRKKSMRKLINPNKFLNLLLYHHLHSGATVEPLYFVKITGKGVAEGDISDPYGYFIAKGKKYFQGLYLKFSFTKSKDQTIFYPAN